MIRNWQNISTIQDALQYCKERASHYRKSMTPKEKEHIAASILPFSFSDYFNKWGEKYPAVYDIEILASDLEWSNSSDIDKDWEKLLVFIAQLEREITHTS